MNLEHPNTQSDAAQTSSTEPSAYEAPAIESVLTPESLEREVLYAGNPPGSPVPI